ARRGSRLWRSTLSLGSAPHRGALLLRPRFLITVKLVGSDCRLRPLPLSLWRGHVDVLWLPAAAGGGAGTSAGGAGDDRTGGRGCPGEHVRWTAGRRSPSQPTGHAAHWAGGAYDSSTRPAGT